MSVGIEAGNGIVLGGDASIGGYPSGGSGGAIFDIPR